MLHQLKFPYKLYKKMCLALFGSNFLKTLVLLNIVVTLNGTRKLMLFES